LKARKPHRGSNGDIVKFATHFIRTRAGGFRKDTGICLTDTPSDDGSSITHAYFPALAACCGFLEYMTDLHRGKLNKSGWPEVVNWAQQYLPQPDYSEDIVRVLFDGFRHSLAHRGIATGIWPDKHPTGAIARKVTWKLFEDAERPACRLVDDVGSLMKDSPWPSPHTHRMHIHLAGLAEDLFAAAAKYADELANDEALQDSFSKAMQTLYPR
jgi:hypothetical protein